MVFRAFFFFFGGGLEFNYFPGPRKLKNMIQGPKLKGSLKYTVHTKNCFHILTMKEAKATENQTSFCFWLAISFKFTERTDRDLSDLIKGNICQLNKCLFHLKETYCFVLIKIRFYIMQVNPALKDFQILKSI